MSGSDVPRATNENAVTASGKEIAQPKQDASSPTMKVTAHQAHLYHLYSSDHINLAHTHPKIHRIHHSEHCHCQMFMLHTSTYVED